MQAYRGDAPCLEAEALQGLLDELGCAGGRPPTTLIRLPRLLPQRAVSAFTEACSLGNFIVGFSIKKFD